MTRGLHIRQLFCFRLSSRYNRKIQLLEKLSVGSADSLANLKIGCSAVFPASRNRQQIQHKTIEG
jgi:hypothetical protein